MARTNSSFKLSKPAKWMIANTPKATRNLVKKMFIDAESTSRIVIRTPRTQEKSE
jgi:hypothetical protein